MNQAEGKDRGVDARAGALSANQDGQALTPSLPPPVTMQGEEKDKSAPARRLRGSQS